MGKTYVRIGLVAVFIAAVVTAFSSCGGGPTSGGEENFDGSSFVDTDDAAGSIRLAVDDVDLLVGETSSFFVRVRDASDMPVPNIEIACDTETGLALVEPATGFELTDSYGNMSGVIGCTLPGSFRMACRLPVGGGKRSFETIHCTGPVPEGFTGFPGAGGGTLGTGGGQPSGDVSVDGNVNIASVDAFDQGTSGSSATADLTIDVAQDVCSVDSKGQPEYEPFFDTVIGVTVTNNTRQSISITSFQYQVLDANGQGDSVKSRVLAFTNAGDVEGATTDGKAGQKQFLGLFAKASGGGKWFNGGSEPIPSGLGFRNVTVRVFGTNGLGQDIELSTRVGLSFDNYNRCSE